MLCQANNLVQGQSIAFLVTSGDKMRGLVQRPYCAVDARRSGRHPASSCCWLDEDLPHLQHQCSKRCLTDTLVVDTLIVCTVMTNVANCVILGLCMYNPLVLT